MLIFFSLAFDIKEVHMLFKKFYKDIDPEDTFKFDFKQFSSIIEQQANDELIGKQNMKLILKSIGVNFKHNIFNMFKKNIPKSN